MTYPPTLLHTYQRCRLVQLSDLHLPCDTSSLYHRQFLTLLEQSMTLKADLLVLTGDLVQDGDKQGYDWLFEQLTRSQLPFVCLAGNHDVTVEHNSHLPFAERTHTAKPADERLLSNHRLSICINGVLTWQLLILDSSVGGQTFGTLSPNALTWLDNTLTQHPLPTLIALHHHPLAVGSGWIDEYQLTNSDDFWQILNRHHHTQAVICGHVHQAHSLPVPTSHACTLYTCPAVSRQFLPHVDEFAIDERPCGGRVIDLTEQNLITKIHRW